MLCIYTYGPAVIDILRQFFVDVFDGIMRAEVFGVHRATCNDKLREAIIAELSTINRNLQMMKEELVDLSLHKLVVVLQSEW